MIKLSHLVMDDSRIRNQKSRFFPKIEKNRNLNCASIFIDVEYIYIIMITWRHFGKPEIVAVINNPILRATSCITADWATVNRSHCTGPSKNKLIHPPRASPPVIHDNSDHSCPQYGEEGDCNLIPSRDTKTAGAVLGVGHQRQMTLHPLHQQEVNNSQLSITLTFLLISLSLKLTERASWFVTIGRNSNNILSTNVSVNQTCPKLVSHHHHHFFY